MPAAPASLHGPRPTPRGPHQRQRPADEAPAAVPGGSGDRQPALVLLRPTAYRQDEAGRPEDLKRLCGPGDRQPAPGDPATIPGPHACGKLKGVRRSN